MVGKNRVVITGIGVLAANGIGKEAFWNTLLAGESGIGPITQFDARDLPCRIAGEITNFDPLDFIDRSLKPSRMGRFSQLSLSASLMAIRDADLTTKDLSCDYPLTIIMGVSTSDFDTILDRPRAYSTSALIPHAPAATVAATLGLNCELITLSNACTSGLDAIAYGAELIRNNKAEVVLAGGSDSSLTKKSLEFLCRGNMLPTSMNDMPKKASRPFDLRRDGGILAEAAGMLLLESEDKAVERGSNIYAEILGYGSRAHFTAQGNELALSAAMNRAMANSCIRPQQIGYINAHAPSDPYVDYMETMAIKNAFDTHAYDIAISSIKGSTGNPLGAGGSLQCIATALSLDKRRLPMTTNYEIQDPDCDLDYISEKNRNTIIEYAMVNSRGVSGNTSSLIMKSYR